jgi:methylated-DNA-[protein]-cysteine S-methyltransferase
MAADLCGTHVFASELGWMALAFHGSRLVRISFGHPSSSAAVASLEAEGVAADSSVTTPQWVTDLAERLQSYAAGSAERFDDVELDLSHLSAFQAKVVKACRRIGRGRVRTYGDLAASCGSPGAARAVGNVMARNRYPIVVPCHRVVGSAGALGGFSARDGVRMKQRMLDLEGVQLPGTARRQRNTNLLMAAGT